MIYPNYFESSHSVAELAAQTLREVKNDAQNNLDPLRMRLAIAQVAVDIRY